MKARRPDVPDLGGTAHEITRASRIQGATETREGDGGAL
jgi:hypothetical protein